MFVTPYLPSNFTGSDRHKMLSLQRKFQDNCHKQANPPKSQEYIRFYVVEWETEGDRGLINAGLNYLNATGWKHTGGTWLSETFTTDSQVCYATAAAWWVEQSES